jgi:DnaJ family protein A protein 5
MAYFSPGAYHGFSDTPKGFYDVYRNLFSQLFKEELTARDYEARQEVDEGHGPAVLHPDWFSCTFGTSNASKSEVDTFYALWESFITAKSFSWVDKWRLTQAPDRRVRRLMEKENTKLRDQAKKEFMESVRKLVAYVKKRDPRLKKFAEQAQAERAKREQEHLSRLKELKLAQQQKVQGYVEQDWSKANYDELDGLTEDEWDSDLDQSEPESLVDGVQLLDLEENTLYCAACEKVFSTDSAMQAHLETKKHSKRVTKLRAQLLHDEGEVLENITCTSSNESQVEGQGDGNLAAEESDPEVVPSFRCIPCEKEFASKVAFEAHTKSKKHLKMLKDAKQSPYKKGAKKPEKEESPNSHAANGSHSNEESTSEQQSGTLPSKKDKPKGVKSQNDAQKCNICHNEFPSRSKLFAHINETGHALAMQYRGTEEDWNRMQDMQNGKKKGKQRK